VAFDLGLAGLQSGLLNTPGETARVSVSQSQAHLVHSCTRLAPPPTERTKERDGGVATQKAPEHGEKYRERREEEKRKTTTTTTTTATRDGLTTREEERWTMLLITHFSPPWKQ